MYSDEYIYSGNELGLFANTPKWKRYIQAEISKITKRQDIGIEIGSGIGSNAPYLSKIVQKYIGIEPDKNLVKISKELNPNFMFEVGSVSHLSKLNIFANIIFYIDVLEHIFEDSLELALAAKFLDKHGKIVVLVPAYEFLFSEFDRKVGHYRRYSKKKLFLVVPDSLKVVEIKYMDSIGAILAFAAKILRVKHAINSKSIKIWHFLIPLSILSDKLFRYRFGKSIFMVLERQNIEN